MGVRFFVRGGVMNECVGKAHTDAFPRSTTLHLHPYNTNTPAPHVLVGVRPQEVVVDRPLAAPDPRHLLSDLHARAVEVDPVAVALLVWRWGRAV